jgi:ATP-dependent DNA helicase Rep
MSLNAEQRHAVEYTQGPLLVLAGAGSGKTRVITEKIAYLIRQCQFPPQQIYALTFTNKAAREMQARVQQLLKLAPDAAKPAISTFHALGMRFLQIEHAALGLRTNFAILGEDETSAIVKDLAPKSAKPDDLNRLRSWISRFKDSELEPEDAAKVARSPKEIEAAHVYAAYQRRLRAMHAVDFDDLIAMPLRALKAEAALRSRWHARIGYLMVDEYQDTNRIQYALIKQLLAPQARLMVVGDDDQSIYAWRGAHPENLIELARDFPTLEVIKLERNYRCSPRVLAAANAVIAHNAHLFEKKLWNEGDPGEAVKVHELKDESAEAEFVAGTIANKKTLNHCGYDAFAVLYRGNHQAKALELALRALNIPYHLSGGLSFFDRQEIKDVLAYLRVLANPEDDAAFLRALATPKRQVGDVSVEKLLQLSQAKRKPLALLLADQEAIDAIAPRSRSALQEFHRLLEQFRQLMVHSRPAALAEAVLNQSGLSALIEATARDPSVRERRLRNVGEFIQWLKSQSSNSGIEALRQALMQLALAGRDEDEISHRVRLMTLHSAKGLEFDHVFLVGVEDGTLPHQSAIDAGNIEEERRLLYVGITRARKSITLSHAKTRMRYGQLELVTPSRFLKELPAGEIQRGDAQGLVRSEDQSRLAKAHLADIAAMLSGKGRR